MEEGTFENVLQALLLSCGWGKRTFLKRMASRAKFYALNFNNIERQSQFVFKQSDENNLFSMANGDFFIPVWIRSNQSITPNKLFWSNSGFVLVFARYEECQMKNRSAPNLS